MVQVIVEDRLTGDREQFTVGGQANGFATVAGGDVLVLGTRAHFTQSREFAHAHTLGGFKVAQAAGLGPEVEGFFRFIPALQHRRGGNVDEDVAEVAGVMGKRHAHHLHRGQGRHQNAAILQRSTGQLAQAHVVVSVILLDFALPRSTYQRRTHRVADQIAVGEVPGVTRRWPTRRGGVFAQSHQ